MVAGVSLTLVTSDESWLAAAGTPGRLKNRQERQNDSEFFEFFFGGGPFPCIYILSFKISSAAVAYSQEY